MPIIGRRIGTGGAGIVLDLILGRGQFCLDVHRGPSLGKGISACGGLRSGPVPMFGDHSTLRLVRFV